ncbi:hypothetical protein COJ85_07455 [Bacillus sp. AFS076308]|nr:hypothetical protein COJ85_07455 [Bacillus sp. AFS076308]PGV52724.1 hypothetical protein COD92_08470 [Bacillus sp. AFS037270]
MGDLTHYTSANQLIKKLKLTQLLNNQVLQRVIMDVSRNKEMRIYEEPFTTLDALFQSTMMFLNPFIPD